MKTTISRVISARPEDVWRVLEDFGHFHRVSPLLECSPITNGIDHGVGAERECVFYDGSTIRERITGVEHGRSLEIAITDSSLPVDHGTVAVRVEPVDATHAQLTFDLMVVPKYGLLGRLLGAIMRPILKSRFNLVIRGIATYLRTGEDIHPSSVLVPV